MNGINQKYYSYLLYALMGVSAIMFLLFMLTDTVGEGMMLNWCFFLLGASAIVAIAFAIIGMIKDFGKAKNTLIGVVVLGLIFVIGYALSSDEVYNIADTTISAGTSKGSEAGLITFYVMAAIAILTIIYTEVSKAFK